MVQQRKNMVWLFVAIGSYTLLAITSLIDKFLLSGPLSDAKLYAFYVGILSSAAFLFLLFGIWAQPSIWVILIGIAAGAAQIYGSYFYLSALRHLEASRAVPIIGSLVPIFGFFLTVMVSGGQAILSPQELAGFVFLIAGGWLIMARGVSIRNDGLRYVLPASFLFALTVILAKLVYLSLSEVTGNLWGFLPLSFANGFLVMSFGSVMAALTFLLSGPVRKTVFGHHSVKKEAKPSFLFFSGQLLGAAAFLLQSFSVSIAPQANVPVINAMAGVQYVFLFFFSMVLSIFFPGIIKEKNDSVSIIQKAVAIVLIMGGLAIFTLK
jgi:hypothetical protein